VATRTRFTLAEGIYQDAHGITVLARIGSKPNLLEAKTRYPLVDNDGIPYSKKNCGELIKCRLQLLEDLRQQRRKAGGEAGTIGAAIDKWKREHPLPERAATNRKLQNDHGYLAHWRTSPLASEVVEDLKRSQVRAQLTTWFEAGASASSVNHRKCALGDLLRWALGADDDSEIRIATDGIENWKLPKIKARGLPMPILTRILANLPDRGRPVKGQKRPMISDTKIRLRVMAWTGLSHISLERLDRTRVNFRDHKIFYPDREKGEGAEGVWADLLPPAYEALRDYDRAGLWGREFSRSSMHGSYRRAVKNTRKQLVKAIDTADEAAREDAKAMLEQFDLVVPANPYPYDTRHSFASDVYIQTGDLKAVKELLQHASLTTTERYTKGAVPARIAQAIDKVRAKWFPDAPKPGATVRDFHVVTK
jgi:integrase